MSVEGAEEKTDTIPEPKEGEPVQFVYHIGSQTQDKSRRLIQRQLILLLHAHNCQKKDKAFAAAFVPNDPNAPTRPKCPIQQCKNMKDVWEHMRRCSVGPDCKFLHCASSLKILAHWKYCTTWECPVCHLIRLKGAQQVGAGLTMKAAETARALAPKQLHSGQQLPPSTPQMNFSSIGSFPNQAQAHPTNNNLKHEEENDQFNRMEQDDCNEESRAEFPVECGDGIGLRGASHYSYNRNLSVPTADEVRRAYEQLGIPCPQEALSRLMATLPGGENQDENVGEEKEDLNECSDSGFVPDEIPSIGAVADDVVHVQADEAQAESQMWRQSMSSLARERLVRQIHEAICVTAGDMRMMGEKDPRLFTSVAFASRIELDAHHFAQSRAEYYELISNKINDVCQAVARHFAVHASSEEENMVDYADQGFHQNAGLSLTQIDMEMDSQSDVSSSENVVDGSPQNIQQLLEGFPCAFGNQSHENQSDINLINLISAVHPRRSPQLSPFILQIPNSSGVNYVSSCRANCQGGPNCPFSLL